YLLERFADTDLQITWITHETAFHALNKGNFSREAYSAGYGMAFARLPEPLREKTLREENDIAFGITPELAKALYQRLYALKYQRDPSSNCPEIHLKANFEVVNVGENADAAMVEVRDLASEAARTVLYSCVILCTGLEEQSVLESALIGPELKSRLGGPSDRQGYAVAWDGPRDRMIFVQSENRKTHGIGDANFVTAPGRNAFILNAIAGKDVYRISQSDRLVDG
ncbi:MAG TPA: SidA/IucD/PvdA family monooxygenase, partial [Lacipirellulaceae bacterium]|nr:SidA/IucD/PvdA family monooxygenase [Lacipirellulaceae bacterium]